MPSMRSVRLGFLRARGASAKALENAKRDGRYSADMIDAHDAVMLRISSMTVVIRVWLALNLLVVLYVAVRTALTKRRTN